MEDAAPVPVPREFKYDINAQFYYIPVGPRTVGENEEVVYHIRSQTKAADAGLRADQALVYRREVRTSCQRGNLVQPFAGDEFASFTENSRYVSLNRYFDHHAERAKDRREDSGLRTYFHFEVSDAGRGCFRTDDSNKVGPLHGAYGFPDVRPNAVLVTRATEVVGPVAADEPTARSQRYAGLSSEFAYVRGPGPVCFSFTSPRPTASSLRGQIFTWNRDYYAVEQAKTWRPIRTDFVIHRVPKGERMTATIIWKDGAGQ
ncbi:hypothetical protein I6F09_18440 [Bradyrhizobium sp. IC3195]|uniref:hypothetical protein n=1 Tax=Bradyrhizobium sp. IC3195 TaxID=2793804 RepID=UPI001CD80BC9|nr:hypothetical protein [Bradyrhizobium sp. IC3195]MCA1469875.1 hypothetical protein [Bradyrhizobium sp. IC3195]